MSEKCTLCGATENLQIHHQLYGDKEIEEKWAVILCVACHQKIHNKHGVGRGEGYTLKKNPDIALKFFNALQKNPKIYTYKLAKIVGISEVTTRKLRKRWGLDKKEFACDKSDKFERRLFWKLYKILEGVALYPSVRESKTKVKKITITTRVEVEEALIKAGVPRKEWADYVNKAALEETKKSGEKDE